MSYMIEAQSQFTKYNSHIWYWRYVRIFHGFWFLPWYNPEEYE